MSTSALFSRALPVLAAVFLQACAPQPETILDQTEETRQAAQKKAEALNKAAARVLTRMKEGSLDGKGHVFFQDGLGIVYSKGLALERSEVIQDGICLEYHPERMFSDKQCAKRIVESFASMPRIHSPAAPQYINARKSLVCPDKASAVQSLSAEFDASRAASMCRDVTPDAFPSPALYRQVMRGIRSSRGVLIEKPSLDWANIMPTSI